MPKMLQCSAHALAHALFLLVAYNTYTHMDDVQGRLPVLLDFLLACMSFPHSWPAHPRGEWERHRGTSPSAILAPCAKMRQEAWRYLPVQFLALPSFSTHGRNKSIHNFLSTCYHKEIPCLNFFSRVLQGLNTNLLSRETRGVLDVALQALSYAST
jgi:hypothetical protein